ncbi:Flp pilus assembly protein CpaB [Spirobacillus cienkowskii]|jgi:Flp pilus assembly protein CpaB|uniref:SAF domain-containing protein n=1 Tax=Spirobacillus cienkowskii TaxID=495820 RepID=A0A369KUL6_9BACT|nr:MAG: hypothetical protein DCC88_02015 [Spirobacillus cienkowskii]
MNNNKIKWNDIPTNSSLHKNIKLVNKKTQILFAIIFAIFQYFLFSAIYTISNNHNSLNKTYVMAAQKDLEPGFIITENDVKVIQVDLGETHNYFINHEENSLILGKKLLTKIYKNSLIPKNSVVSINHKNSLLEKIPLGKRLFTLNLELENYLNILKIGDKIDLIAYLEIPGFGKATETILSGIEIIAITNQFHAKERKTTSNSISFYLFPEEVKVLSFMKQYAKFSISLRNPNDISSHSGEAMTLNKFIQNEKIQKIIKNDGFQIIQGKKQ